MRARDRPGAGPVAEVGHVIPILLGALFFAVLIYALVADRE